MKNTVFKNIVKGALSLKLVLAIALAFSTSTVVHAQQSSFSVSAPRIGGSGFPSFTPGRGGPGAGAAPGQIGSRNLQDLANISPSAGGEDGANDVSDADPS